MFLYDKRELSLYRGFDRKGGFEMKLAEKQEKSIINNLVDKTIESRGNIDVAFDKVKNDIMFKAKKEDLDLALNDKINFYDSLADDFRRIKVKLRKVENLEELKCLFQEFNDRIQEIKDIFEEDVE